MKPATSLAEVINTFDPHAALHGDELASFYVERERSPLSEIKTQLLVARMRADRKAIKLLFSGHTGSGKSTELNKLSLELRHQFFIVAVPMQQLVPLIDLTYVDILLSLATALFQAASARSVIAEAPAQVLGELWDDLRLFLENTLLGGQIFQTPAVSSEVTLKVNLLAVEFQNKYKTEVATRDQVRQRMENRLAEVVDKINMLADQVQARYGRPVLFIVEGTDKLDPARARDIFFGHPQPLTDLRAFAIYTFPIGLRYSKEFNFFKSYFDDHPILPNLKPRDRIGASFAPGLARLEEIITRRMSPDLLAPDVCRALIEACGGLTRTLITLVRKSAVNALARGAVRIELADVEYAINTERGDYIAALESADYPILAARHLDKRLSGDESMQKLLQALALLEYVNQEPWCDVHPIVLPEVEKRVGPERVT